jgi:anti-sigma B factor antagonist
MKSTYQLGGPLVIDVDASGALVVHGDIDIAGAPTLKQHLLRSRNQMPVVLDLADVGFIDSSGVRALVAASEHARQRDAVVRLRNVGANLRRMLEITGTADKFEIEE